ncbi:MAG: hypothetical protein WAN61_00200 [Minisyncoccia bacterium]
MLPQNIIYITILTSLVGYFFYLKKIFYGEVRPNLISWFLWMLAPFIGVFFQIKAGAGLSALPVFMAGFGPLVVIIISLFRKSSIWKVTSFDIFCGLLSLFALVSYVVIHSFSISILFAILSDGLAAVPTIIKSWKFPETETAAVYLPGIFNNILALFVIKNWIFSIYSFNIYIILVNIIIIFCIYHKKLAIS